MTTKTPCQLGDSEDWFIEKDGKQYRDDPILTSFEADVIVDRLSGTFDPERTVEEYDAACGEAIEAAEAEKIRLALIRRRKAREACFECPVRSECLRQRLEAKVEHGIWGGYYPEDLRKLDEEIEKRQSVPDEQ